MRKATENLRDRILGCSLSGSHERGGYMTTPSVAMADTWWASSAWEVMMNGERATQALECGN